MKLVLVILVGLVLCGCADERVPILEGQMETKTRRITQLQQEFEESTRKHSAEIDDLRTLHRQNERELARTADVANKLVEDKNREIAKLQKELRRKKEHARELEDKLRQQARAPAAPASPADAVPGPKVVTSAPVPKGVPVRVFDVIGIRVVTGSHTVMRLVETDEVYRDDFGNRRKKMERIEDTVLEYGYQVAFSAENLTDKEQVIAVRAGVSTQDVTVPPGGAVKKVVIDSAVGSSLMVMAGSRTQRFPVTYE